MAEMQSLGDAVANMKSFSRAPKLNMTPQQAQEWRYKQDREADAQNYQKWLKLRRATIRGFSVWGTCGRQKFTSEEWRTDLQPTEESCKKAYDLKAKAANIANRLKTESFNVLFAGQSGVGKTSLALVVLDHIEKTTNKSIMYVSVTDLRELILGVFNDPEAKKRLDHIERAMREADVLMLDDLGSESGGMKGGGQATESVQRFYYRIAEHRQKRVNGKRIYTNIITTNNSKEELNAIYNEKIISRLLTKNVDNMLIFKGMEDMRID